MNLLDELNKEQRKAVEAEGPVIIIAGPGTGKTKTLTSRIAYLIQNKHVNPTHILALTFTKKAATEMKERLQFLQNKPYISTFHSLALDILKNKNQTVSIITENDKESLLYMVYKKQNRKEGKKKDIKELSLFISNFKNNLYQQHNEVVDIYNKLLNERNVIDYDDLLLKVYKLLQKGDQHQQFQFILVDEFQDTNNLQYEIIKLLLTNEQLFVIGDPYQSIYSFRGANESILNELQTDFPHAKTINLHTNYRSTTEIITSSISLFPKKINLIAFSKEKGEVQQVTTVNEFTEAEWIVETINKKIGGIDLIKAGDIQAEHKRETCFKDFAVIYRTHALSRILEQKFIDSGIPYQVIGGNSLYEKPEVAFVITLLQYLHFTSVEYLYQLLTSPVLGFTKQSKERLYQLYMKGEEVFLHEITMNKGQSLLQPKDMKILSTFIESLNNVVTKVDKHTLSNIIHNVFTLNVLQQYIDQKEMRKKHIHQLQSMITQFKSISKTCDYFAFLQEHEFYDPTVDKVTLLTMHAAKGLEFSCVFIAGFEEEIMPYIKKDEKSNIEEEKRLLYVAMTRAKTGLYLLLTVQRNKQQTKPSRFKPLLKKLTCIEDEAIRKREKKIKKWKEKKSQMTLF